MPEFTKQLIIVADTLPKNIRNKSIDWDKDLYTELKDMNLLYTSLLPGPELQAAIVARNLDIPYIANIPFKNWYKIWPKKIQQTYLYYLKKAVRVVYVDRQPGYISKDAPPDVFGGNKITKQTHWAADRVKLFTKATKILTYTVGFYSVRTHLLNTYLLRMNEPEKWVLSQCTQMGKQLMRASIISDDDDLPF